MTTAKGHVFVLRGWHVLAVMLAFFGLVIGVNVYFAIAAVQTFPGEDVTHPYIQGLEYNRTLAERRAQAALGWRANAALEAERGGAVLLVEIHQRDGTPLDGAHIDGALRWPMDAHRDHVLEFQQVGPGRYVAHLGTLAAGDWDLRAHALNGGDALDFEADLTWPTSP